MDRSPCRPVVDHGFLLVRGLLRSIVPFEGVLKRRRASAIGCPALIHSTEALRFQTYRITRRIKTGGRTFLRETSKRLETSWRSGITEDPRCKTATGSPFLTRSPNFLVRTKPAAGSTESPNRERPAPRARTKPPTSRCVI